jgi:hypothetical protein
MNWWHTVLGWGHSAWSWLTGIGHDVKDGLNSVFQFAISIAQVIDWVVSHPFVALAESTIYLVDLITGNAEGMQQVANREHVWIYGNYVQPIRPWVMQRLNALYYRIAYLIDMVYVYVNARIRQTRQYALELVKIERRERIRDFHRSEAYTRAHVKAAVGLIQRQAATAYNAEFKERLGLIATVLDLAATRVPLVKDAVADLIEGVLDLLAIEDPLARLALGFALSRVIDRLGVERPIGDLAAQLLGPIIGSPKPRDLHAVVMDLAERIEALEMWEAQFMADGGSQILQAGQEWKAITGPLADLGILAFATYLATDPDGWASEMSGTVGNIVSDGILAVATFIKDV